MQTTSAVEPSQAKTSKPREKSSHGRKYGERDSHPIYLWNGILEPKHLKKLGPAFSLFVWLIDRTTKEHDGIGAVLGGKPLKAEEIGSSMGVYEQTIRRRLDRLESHGYIERTLTPYGYVVKVMKSCKFPKRAVSEVVQECPTSQDTGRAEVPDQVVQECPTCPGKTARPNKSKQLSKQGRKQKEVQPPAPQPGATDQTLTGFELTAPPEPAEPVETERRGDSRYTPFLKYAYEAFHGRYGVKPSWGPKDFAGLKNLLARSTASVEDIQRRFVNFLASTKQYVRDKGGSLAFFCSEFDSFIEGPREDFKPVTFDEQRRKNSDEAMDKLFEHYGVDPAKAVPTFPALLPAKTPALPERAGQAERLTERQALALVLRDNSALEDDPRLRVVPEKFQRERHQVIFYAMQRMRRDGLAITVDYLIAWLRERGELERAGGTGYIKGLAGDVPAGKVMATAGEGARA